MNLVEADRVSLPGRLHQTSLGLGAGELTCLIGPNGSGKTSLLHALAGIGHRSGRVRIGGLDPAGLPPAERQRLFSYLPTSRDVHWPLTGRDMIALGATGLQDAAWTKEVLEALHLTELADRRIDRMSTGERSRVLIARALVSRPKLLLLDEPAANLDPLWQLRLMEHLRNSAVTNKQAMLVAVHDLEIARCYADRLIIMEGGAIAADGDPQPLLQGPEITRIFGIAWHDGRWHPVA